MTAYDIINIPDPVLKQTAMPVEHVDEGVLKQIERMRETLDAAGGGVGLAANQVSLLNRVLLADFSMGPGLTLEEKNNILQLEWTRDDVIENDLRAMINPEILWSSEQKCSLPQGCLSIPGQYGDVIRPMSIKGTYIDESGDKKEFEAEGLTAQIIQHEIDHLNGVLFIDYLSNLKRNMILKKFRKAQK